MRQIGFHNFETRVHDQRQIAELTLDQISDIWMDTQSEALGHLSVLMTVIARSGDLFLILFMCLFMFMPMLSGMVWLVHYGKNINMPRRMLIVPDFVAAYQDLLRAGGTKRHDEALAPFGLDARQPEFWSSGLGMISGMIDQLENELSDETVNGKC